MKLPEAKQSVERPIYLNYRYRASKQASRFLHAVKQGKLVAVRSSGTHRVLVPPPGVCPESGTLTGDELIELPDTGTILGFTIVHLPIPNSRLKPPFVVANILLDGADQAFSHLVSECAPSDVCIGSRVRAHWKPQQEWDFGLENIDYFILTGESPVNIDALRQQRLGELQDA